jgi:hypothetical protein
VFPEAQIGEVMLTSRWVLWIPSVFLLACIAVQAAAQQQGHMAGFTRQLIGIQLIGQWRRLVGRFSLRRAAAAPSVYLAFSIGPELLATAVHELDAQSDEDALEKATPLFHDGLKRIEVWCASRQVGNIPPKVNDIADGGAVRDSA